MNRVLGNVEEGLRRADVVGEASNGCLMASHVVVLPLAEESDDEVASELLRQNLSEEVDIAHKGSLEDNGYVRSVEQLNGEGLLQATLLARGKRELNGKVLNNCYFLVKLT